MTVKELSQLYYLKREIEKDKQRLWELGLTASGLGAQNLTGMPRGNGTETKLERNTNRKLELERIIKNKIERCEHERLRIEQYIASVEDSQMRLILTYRFIDNCSWKQVAIRIKGGNTADSVRMACKRFLNEK